MRAHIRRRIAAAAICVVGSGLLGILALPPGSPARAQPDTGESPLAWLRSAATAPRRTSYAGTKTVTVWAGTVQASKVRVYHAAPDRTRLEYPAAGTQPARTVVITGRAEVEFIPARNELIRRPAPAADEEGLTRGALPRILENYDVRFDGAEKVAGRSTRIIDVRGRLPGRPHLRIWVDTETRLILRFERYGPGGALREASAFLSIEVNPPLSADLFALTPPPGVRVQTRPAGGRLTLEQIAQRVGFTPRLPAYLPPGYQRAGSRVTTIRGTLAAVFAFSDGVSTLTLFESRGPQGSPRGGRPVRIGAADGTMIPRGVATLLHWNAGGISFTLVGDLPQDELVRVGASVPHPRASRVPPAGAAEAAGIAAPAPGSPVPGPYITNDTHPIGPGIRAEEEEIWTAMVARGLAPFIVKITVASDGVSRLPDGRIARLAWIAFVYGMDSSGDPAALVREAQERARALSAAALLADPRVRQVTLSGFYHRRGWFDGGRTDATLTARVFGDRLLAEPAGLAPGDALARAGDVWYSPDLLAGAPLEPRAGVSGPHVPGGVRSAGPRRAGDRGAETAERFQGSVLERVVEAKDRLAGLLFGVESRGRLWRGNPRRREVALTFDDGPSPLVTPLLLAILHRYGTPATFFVIGAHARAYPYLVAEMAAAGDEVGDHTFDHPNLTSLSPQAAAQEIDAAAEVIREVTGRPPRWFRPPGGDYTAAVADAARRAGMGLAMWTENSGDWAAPPAKTLADQVPLRVEPGSIILLHSTTLVTARALPQIIVELRRRGYTLVTLSQLARDAE